MGPGQFWGAKRRSVGSQGAAAEVWCPLPPRTGGHGCPRAAAAELMGISSRILLGTPSRAGRNDFSLTAQHASQPEIILVFCMLNLSSFLSSLCVMFWSSLLCLGRGFLFVICIIKPVVSLDQKFFFELHRRQLLLKCVTLILCVCSQETKWADFSSCSMWFCQARRPYFISTRPVSIHSFDKFEENSCFPQCKYGKEGAETRHLLFMSHSSYTMSCIKAVLRWGQCDYVHFYR